MADEDELCRRCGHLFDPHVLMTTAGEVADGGVMLCPTPGCECLNTWGLAGAPATRVPDSAEIALLRERIQRR